MPWNDPITLLNFAIFLIGHKFLLLQHIVVFLRVIDKHVGLKAYSLKISPSPSYSNSTDSTGSSQIDISFMMCIIIILTCTLIALNTSHHIPSDMICPCSYLITTCSSPSPPHPSDTNTTYGMRSMHA